MNTPSKIRPNITKENFDEVAKTLLYPDQFYVREYIAASRCRFYLKSRQVRFSFYYALKAFEDK